MSMKKIYLYTLLLGLAAGMSSCEDDATPVLSVKSNAVLEALPQAEYTFTAANAADAFTVKWTPTDYGFQSVSTYTVTLSNPANGKSVNLGTATANELALTNEQINNYLGQLNVYPGQTGELAIFLDYSAYDGKLDSIADNVIKFKATPYDPKAVNVNWKYAYVAVYSPKSTRAANDVDWDWTKAYMIGDVDGDGTYEGWVNIDTDNMSYKILDGKTYEALAEGTAIAKKGFYQIKVTSGVATISADAAKWGISGNATSKNEDVEMEYNTDDRVWTKALKLKAGESFKFRANGKDDAVYGAVAGKETELSGALIPNGNNLIVTAPKDTTFIVKINLTEAGKYTYSMEMTPIELSSEFITLPGGYQGWKPEDKSAIKLTSKDRDFTYVGTGYMTADTYKFYDGGTWYGLNGKIAWDDESKTAGSFAVSTSGGDVKMENAAYYHFDVNLKKLTAKIYKSGWEVIGDATPGAWDKGTVMDYNPTTKLWSVTMTLKSATIKFRWDGSWDKNFGGSLDNLIPGSPDNIPVSAGTYEIVLNPDAKTATMTKK